MSFFKLHVLKNVFIKEYVKLLENLEFLFLTVLTL